jgi:hypothetical protein
MTTSNEEKTEKVISFGGFIPEWAKGLPRDLDFSSGYLLDARNQIVASLPGVYLRDKLYEDVRTLSCVRTILAGEQWDDPNAEKYVERYTGKWGRVEELYVPSRTIDHLVLAFKKRDRSNKTIADILNGFLVQKLGGAR